MQEITEFLLHTSRAPLPERTIMHEQGVWTPFEEAAPMSTRIVDGLIALPVLNAAAAAPTMPIVVDATEMQVVDPNMPLVCAEVLDDANSDWEYELDDLQPINDVVVMVDQILAVHFESADAEDDEDEA